MTPDKILAERLEQAEASLAAKDQELAALVRLWETRAARRLGWNYTESEAIKRCAKELRDKVATLSPQE